jgi:hypothetical protein
MPMLTLVYALVYAPTPLSIDGADTLDVALTWWQTGIPEATRLTTERQLIVANSTGQEIYTLTDEGERFSKKGVVPSLALLPMVIVHDGIWALGFDVSLRALAMWLNPLVTLATAYVLMRLLGMMGAGLGLSALVGWYQWTAAPFPNAFNAILATLQNDFSAGIIALLDNINLNVNLLSQGDPVEQWGRWHLALISMALLPWALVLVVRERDQRVMLAKSLGWQIALHSYNLLVTLALVVVLYDIGEWRDLRIIAPRILLSLVIFVGMNQRFLVLVAILPLVFVLPDSLRIHDIWSGFHINPERPAQFEQWSQDLPDVLAYQKDAPSRWCNTVYHSTWYLFNQVPMLMAMPAGMGLTYPDVEAPTLPLRSRYLLLTDDDFALIGDTLEVTRLRDMPNGALYLNADAPCPTE